MQDKPAPTQVYGVLSKITLADSNSKPGTNLKTAAKPKLKRRKRSDSQPAK